jgi:DNA-directed RNA polymerase specialized sigma24 family protein
LTENEREWALLRADPGALVLKYQETIRIIVRRFIGTGMFSAREFEDVVQSVNAGLLSRTSSMQRNYSGRSLLATYVSAIIRNICLKLRRAAGPPMPTPGDLDPEEPDSDNVFSAIAIGETSAALAEVLDLFHTEKGRLRLLLKVHFKLPLTSDDILASFPGCKSRDVRRILALLGRDLWRRSERELYSDAASFLNEREGRSTTPDAYRRWTSEKISEILSLLGSRLPEARLTKEDLRTLMENQSIQT